MAPKMNYARVNQENRIARYGSSPMEETPTSKHLEIMVRGGNKPSHPTSEVAKYKKCPECDCTIRAKKLPRHLSQVHQKAVPPTDKLNDQESVWVVSAATCIRSAQRNIDLGRQSQARIDLDHALRILQEKK